MSRGRLVVVLAAAIWLALPATAQSALRWRTCAGGNQCARLGVPLDRGGAVAGSLSLRVLRERGHGRAPEGVTLVLGPDPGESTVRAFTKLDALASLADVTDHRIVLLDQRGTGGSGPLRCRDLEAATATDAGREAAACATLLGPRRALYRTSDTVADIEALRSELGAERLTLVGVAYGAYVAQRYALRHPDRVERMVLDSPVDAAGLDPLQLDSFAAFRRVLPLICRAGCDFTPDASADAARLGERLEREPLRGYVVGLDGKRRAARLTPQDLLFVAGHADRDLFARVDLPAAVVSALRGDAAPLFRLKREAVLAARTIAPDAMSLATRAAVLCEEVRFPWGWHATAAERDAAIGATAASLAPDAVSPFGAGAAARSEVMRLCRRWPTLSAAPPDAPGAMPDIPVLVVAGDAHVHDPLETARRTAARFPRASVVVAPSTFGSPVAGLMVECTTQALKRFFAGRAPATRCPRSTGVVPPGRPAPTSLARLKPVPGVPGDRGRLLRAFELTVDDMIGRFLSAQLVAGPRIEGGARLRGAGLRGGRFAFGDGSARLERYELVPGVRVSIRTRNDEDAVFAVDGPRRLDGRVRIVDEDTDEGLHYRVRGRVGGRRFRARLRFSDRLLGLFAVEAGSARAYGGR